MTVAIKAAALLRTAAGNISDDTWCRHTENDNAGRRCAVGHVLAANALQNDRGFATAVEALDRAAERVGSPDVVDWNDFVADDASTVKAFVLRAADELEAAS
jgi:hypothetical protein